MKSTDLSGSGGSADPVDPGFRARFFAKVWGKISAGVDASFRESKDEIFVDLPDQILELGAGLGDNFKRYAVGTRVLAFEPNTAMHEGLRKAAADQGLELTIDARDLRDSGLADASQSLVVSTLVLCCVGDQAAMVAEIRRVLAPGGRFIFVEHVAAEDETTHRIQRLWRVPWGIVGDGCDPAPSTVSAIEQAGFGDLDAQRGRNGSVLNPTHPVYWGIATS